MSASVSKEDLRKEIHLILKDADLTSTSSKAVRLQLEKKLKVNLLERKKEVDELVMEYVNPPGDENGDEESAESSSESEEDKPQKKAAAKRPPPTIAKKSASKKKKYSSESEKEESNSDGAPSEDEEEDSEDDEPKKKKPVVKPKKSGRGRKKADDDSGSDGDWKNPKKKKKAAGPRGNGYTRPYTLSPELASLVGAESLPRHEVVKKMWAIIKERNLYDPKNKQFAICDADMLKVIGVKRFRTFGMMKYLKNHFN